MSCASFIKPKSSVKQQEWRHRLYSADLIDWAVDPPLLSSHGYSVLCDMYFKTYAPDTEDEFTFVFEEVESQIRYFEEELESECKKSYQLDKALLLFNRKRMQFDSDWFAASDIVSKLDGNVSIKGVGMVSTYGSDLGLSDDAIEALDDCGEALSEALELEPWGEYDLAITGILGRHSPQRVFERLYNHFEREMSFWLDSTSRDLELLIEVREKLAIEKFKAQK